MKLKLLFLLCLILSILFNCSNQTKQEISVRPGEPLVDPRDGRVYQTVWIGDQCWIAENLDVGEQADNCQQTDNGIIEKTCYENDCDNSTGGLYTWREAMNYSEQPGARGVCPPGWHIPTAEEFDALRQYLGADSAGQKMKASPTDSISWDGTNKSGFTAIPSGVGFRDSFGRKGDWAVYWTSTQKDSAYAWFAQLDNFWQPQPPKYLVLYLGDYFLKDNAFCIRCIQDKLQKNRGAE